MINYETDEERAEAIKKWWKENGLSIMLGVGLGLGAIFGWRAWTDYQETVRQQASAAFEQLLADADADTGNTESVLAQARLLREEFSTTTYATLAALVQARIERAAGNSAGARAALEQALAESPDPGIRRIAALRLIRLLIAAGDLEQAAGLAAKHDDDGAFGGAFAALRGDIAAAQGHATEARTAYEQALAGGAPNPDQVRRKLDDLPPTG